MKWQRFWGEKWPISYRVSMIVYHAHTGSGCGTKFPTSFARCLKNTHTMFEACGYNSFQDMRNLSQTFRFCAKWFPFLRSYNYITYMYGTTVTRTPLYVLYSSARFISEAQCTCSPEAAWRYFLAHVQVPRSRRLCWIRRIEEIGFEEGMLEKKSGALHWISIS